MLLLLPSEIAQRFRRHLVEAGADEIGGILMGEQLSLGKFRIVDFSVDAGRRERDRFLRDMDHHAHTLRRFFERTGGDYERFNYLGEWHSHPRFSVAPSSTDLCSMQAMVDGDEGIAFAALLILKLRRRDRLQASATLFTTGQHPGTIPFLQEADCDRPT
ncbi:Mov34/MPN/PAD-1 family protein [Aureimonas phyllosphaerae]|uniref:Mov34/MPN/PAD-1 family protein n=1 Tax=Aureimonas phyllosphaerae TaxID=1166078 RepID=UPI003A5C290E